MLFLGEALTTMLVYIWCRRNPYVRYNFFGLFTFEAPYLPWILVLISILFGGSVLADLVGETHIAHTPLIFKHVDTVESFDSRGRTCIEYYHHHLFHYFYNTSCFILSCYFVCLGIAVGHVYYFLEDVFPSKPGGFKILKTPHFM